MAETKFGTFEELLATMVPVMQPIAQELRKVVIEVDPHTVEVVRLGDSAASYGLGPKKMSESYVYISGHQNWVNLGFYKGADLADPAGLLEGSGKKLRHIKIHSVEEAQKTAVRQLIMQAINERKQALDK